MSAKIRALQEKKAAAVEGMRKLADTVAAENRDFSAEEQAKFDEMQAQAAAAGKAIEREQALAVMEAGLSRPAPSPAQPQAPPAAGSDGVTIPASAAISVTDNVTLDPRRGFRSQGDFFKAVRAAAEFRNTGQGAMDSRLLPQAAAPGVAMNETNGADGAYAIPPAFSTEIWRLSLEEGSLVPMTANTEVSSNSMMFPKDETAPWSTSGVQAYWRGEAAAAAASKALLSAEMMRLKELTVMVPVTNELLEDAPALGTYLTPLAADRIQWKTNEAILFGAGGGQPLGCLNPNAGALIVQAKETSQATATILQMNISRMRSRLKAGELKNSVWIGNPDLLPALESMTVGQIPVFLSPQLGIKGQFDGTLSGRPLILSEHAAGLGSQSDLSLVSLKGYRTITKAGGVETATSMHLYFDANATAFRFLYRIDGQPITSAPIPAPAGKGSQTRSYFVTLAARP